MSPNKYPTSPHLQIYRLPLTGLLSITHRITGVILALGCIVMVWVLAAAAQGAATYEALVPHLASWYGQLYLAGFIFSLYLHFCNGVRHLFWDAGYGFELDTVDLTAKLAIALAVILTVATWVVAGVG
ncbi:MAG: succinate dehydrogenase, cytochrome b556 subunit [Gammaproteobacteria bacterium]|nr:succinate dehydrogenase, cytochrome b556 subunit [Gammaproteobacteria bacterium]MDH3446823.1 succinate dehydrogenase, cytochrome b556 subunit [Gammaproteobacteria bacterium]